MTRLLKQFILTTMLALFASQASALFVQPDTFDPRMQGVGTNRYAYAGGDPVNNSDQNGHQWRYQDFSSQEEADNYFATKAADFYSRANAIRSSDSLFNIVRNAIGIDEEMIGYGDQYLARLGLTSDERRQFDNNEMAQAAFDAAIGGIALRGVGMGSKSPMVQSGALPRSLSSAATFGSFERTVAGINLYGTTALENGVFSVKIPFASRPNGEPSLGGMFRVAQSFADEAAYHGASTLRIEGKMVGNPNLLSPTIMNRLGFSIDFIGESSFIISRQIR